MSKDKTPNSEAVTERQTKGRKAADCPNLVIQTPKIRASTSRLVYALMRSERAVSFTFKIYLMS